MTAIVLDCETTGITDPEVIELAFSGPHETLHAGMYPVDVKRFRPSKPITLGAMAAHHIIAEDLAKEPPWPGTWLPPAGVEYIIGHNVDYDWKAIGSPHVARICTLALSRSLFPDLDSHSLSAMTYHFIAHHIARDLLQKRVHNAGNDVELCRKLLDNLLLTSLPTVTTWHDLWLASEKARVPVYMTFGKYGPDSEFAKSNGGRGMRCVDVRRFDPGYWSWLMEKCDQVRDDPYYQKALRGG